jgi:hypothetical protein
MKALSNRERKMCNKENVLIQFALGGKKVSLTRSPISGSLWPPIGCHLLSHSIKFCYQIIFAGKAEESREKLKPNVLIKSSSCGSRQTEKSCGEIPPRFPFFKTRIAGVTSWHCFVLRELVPSPSLASAAENEIEIDAGSR